MTTIDSDSDPDDCIHGIWPATQCSICSHNDARRAAAANEITHRFTARFDGHCGRCGAATYAGEDLGATNDGRYLCGECT